MTDIMITEAACDASVARHRVILEIAMRYTIFGRRTGLSVSDLALGTGSFGTAWAHEIIGPRLVPAA